MAKPLILVTRRHRHCLSFDDCARDNAASLR